MSKRKGIKLLSYSLKRKAEIIEQFVSSGLSKRRFSDDYNIPRGTLQGIMKNRNRILSAIRDGTKPKKKRLRQGKLGHLEHELIEWTSDKNNKGIAVTGDMLKVNF